MIPNEVLLLLLGFAAWLDYCLVIIRMRRREKAKTDEIMLAEAGVDDLESRLGELPEQPHYNIK